MSSPVDRTNRDPILGTFNSQTDTFVYNHGRDRIQHCEVGVIAWFKHVFGRNIYLDTTEDGQHTRRVYVPVTEAKTIIANNRGRSPRDCLNPGERIGDTFARIVRSRETMAQHQAHAQRAAHAAAQQEAIVQHNEMPLLNHKL